MQETESPDQYRWNLLHKVTVSTSREQPEIKDQIDGQEISIYPNPVQSEITVKIPELEEGEYADISLYGQGGQLLYRNEKAGYNNIINFSEFPAGIYFMTITIREKSIQWKVVKE